MLIMPQRSIKMDYFGHGVAIFSKDLACQRTQTVYSNRPKLLLLNSQDYKQSKYPVEKTTHQCLQMINKVVQRDFIVLERKSQILKLQERLSSKLESQSLGLCLTCQIVISLTSVLPVNLTWLSQQETKNLQIIYINISYQAEYLVKEQSMLTKNKESGIS